MSSFVECLRISELLAAQLKWAFHKNDRGRKYVLWQLVTTQFE
jgi:hypothetical protein